MHASDTTQRFSPKSVQNSGIALQQKRPVDMKSFFFVVVLSLAVVPIGVFAQAAEDLRIPESSELSESYEPSDTSTSRSMRWLDRVAQTRVFQATYLGVPLIAGGLIEKHQDSKFRRLRNDFMPQFQRHLDDFTQLAPAAVLVGMKAAGVKGRSSWGRMIVSDAISAAIMAGTVQGLKQSTHVVRPDGSNDQSFPSGHTATAFMTATMLNKEYGHLSPWVGIGAYTCATATGLMRMANNKHWLSDVMVGAGIGIISTELGYWLADAIFHDRGLNVKPSSTAMRLICQSDRPSFLGLYMGFNVPLSHYDIDETTAFETSTGTTIGLEGAYFFSPYIGAGARGSISNLQYIVNRDEAPDNTFNFYSLGVGPYFSLPLTPRWSLGSKLLVGSVYYPAAAIGDVDMPKNQRLSVGTGLSVSYQVRERLAGSLFLDYNIQAPQSLYSGEYLHLMTIGARISVSF